MVNLKSRPKIDVKISQMNAFDPGCGSGLILIRIQHCFFREKVPRIPVESSVADPKTFSSDSDPQKFFSDSDSDTYGFCRHVLWDKPFQSFLLIAYEHFLNSIFKNFVTVKICASFHLTLVFVMLYY
jgi:hypothetical protein